MEFSSSFLKVLCKSLRRVTLIPFSTILCVNYGTSLIVVMSIIKKKCNCFALHFIFTAKPQYLGSTDLMKRYFVHPVLFFFLHIQHVFLSYEAVTEYHNMKLSLTVGPISRPLSLLYRCGMMHNTNLAPHLTMAESMHSHCA